MSSYSQTPNGFINMDAAAPMFQVGTFICGSDSASATDTSDLSSFVDIDFPVAFPDGYEVVVILQTQSFNGSNTPGIRISSTSSKGFSWRFNEVIINVQDNSSIVSDGTHYEETVAWLAYAYMPQS